MTESTRRSFLQHTALASAGASAWTWNGGINAAGANDRLAIGVIGCGGQGARLASAFAELADIACVCDPDESRRRQLQEKVRAKKAVADLRRVLDDKAVDAVVVATPDHWHAPAALLACEAGKHVYVEKPQSHNLHESRLLLDAARRNKVVVQHGTQSRSDPLVAGAVQMLREGVIGDVLGAKTWNVQQRGNIGHEQPSDPPAGMDYDMWVGPAEFVPFQKNRFHYDWHWWYNFGTGDIGQMHQGHGIVSLRDVGVGAWASPVCPPWSPAWAGSTSSTTTRSSPTPPTASSSGRATVRSAVGGK